MPFARVQIAYLAIAALLFAGWTGATHFHFGGGHGHSGTSHADLLGHFDSRHFGLEGGHSHPGQPLDVAQSCPGATNEASTSSGDSCCPALPSDTTEADCELCQLLAGHVFCLVLDFDLAGVVVVEQPVSEHLWSAPTGVVSTPTCRGPPLRV